MGRAWVRRLTTVLKAYLSKHSFKWPDEALFLRKSRVSLLFSRNIHPNPRLHWPLPKRQCSAAVMQHGCGAVGPSSNPSGGTFLFFPPFSFFHLIDYSWWHICMPPAPWHFAWHLHSNTHLQLFVWAPFWRFRCLVVCRIILCRIGFRYGFDSRRSGIFCFSFLSQLKC
jgi:hypothetical protein